MRLCLVGICACAGILVAPSLGLPQEEPSGAAWSHAPTVYLDVDASTWKTRGRLLYDIEGTVLKKLASAGFHFVRNEQDEHELTLVILYREERGEQYNINAFGTVIHGRFYLDPQPSDSSWEFSISETSSNSISGTPPYLDALEKFETNPYYFFLGDILRGHIQLKLDPSEGLIYALEQMMSLKSNSIQPDNPTLTDPPRRPEPHAMRSSQELYTTTAVQRAIDEYVDSRDRRILPVLFRLIHHRATAIRLRAVEALGVFQARESRPYLAELSQKDHDPQVRQTAKAVFDLLTPEPPAE